MPKVFQIARWEYLRRVKSKAFLFTLVLPFIIIALAAFPQYLAMEGSPQDRTIAVLSNNAEFMVDLERLSNNYFEGDIPYNYRHLARPDSSLDLIRELLASAVFDAVLVVPDDFFDSAELSFYAADYGIEETDRLRGLLNYLLLEERLDMLGIAPEYAESIREKVDLHEYSVSGEGDISVTNALLKYILPFIFLFVLVMGLITSSQALISSIIEERSSRIAEILLSAVSPLELMGGKILGMGLLGLTQLAFYLLVIFYAGGSFLDQELGGGALAVDKLIWYMLFFVAGYFLYSGIYISMGALFDNERDAQQVSGVLSIFLIMPIYFIPFMLENPDSSLTGILTLVPLLTPFFMIAQIGIFELSPWYNLAVFVYLILWLTAVTYAAARIFRTALLLYGKRITLPEIMRWIRS